jgi:cytoskeletal protein RodZ
MLKTGETTVVQPQAPVVRRGVAPWALGVAALVLIGVLFGGFYAYQRRNSAETTAPNAQPNVNAAPVEPSPAPEHATSEPASGNLNEQKQAVTNTPPPANEPAKKIEKTAKKNKAEKNPANVDEEPDTNAGEHYPMKDTPETPDAPELFIPNNTPRTRTLRDGTQVTIMPDGRRIVTLKDGTVRVIPPGTRLLRRRRVN